MSAEPAKRMYGDEYPAAAMWNGVRLPLVRESRFWRDYYSKVEKQGLGVSRFRDGSASMTFPELETGWPDWNETERLDFCHACPWLHEQPDYPDMLRFVIKHGNQTERAAVALRAAERLPCNEAFELVLPELRASEIGRASNFAQAVAVTKHPQAANELRRHLEKIWSDEKLWDDDEFLNWVAYDAEKCLQHLIELGVPPGEFETQVRQLSTHICAGNRDSCRRWLAKYYSWLA